MKKELYKVVLAGNPNVGKSTVFNALTGMNQHTGNWAGKTVSIAKGICKFEENTYEFIDIPGTYSLCGNSPEEEIARDFICFNDYDAIVVVCDATTLERNLKLVLQILEVTKKVVVCVNLIDEARKKGINIDLKRLSELLGVKVVGTIARNKKTLKPLLSVLDDIISNDFEETSFKIKYENIISDSIINSQILKAEEISKSVILKDEQYNKHNFNIDKILTSKKIGYPVMILLFGVIFWITITGANYFTEILSYLFSIIENHLIIFLLNLKASPIIMNFIIEGVYRVPSWVISVMLPPMAIFFPLFTLLEDLGYLPRIAYNLDKPFKRCGSCGKQALTMCMGFGCNAVGVTGCRIIDSKRERLLAILTNSFVPCNGRFPTIIAMITMFFSLSSGLIGSIKSALVLLLVILFSVFMTFLATKILSLTIFKGLQSSYILELPPYRKPQICRSLVRSLFDRTIFVLGRSLIVAIPCGMIIWFLNNLNINGNSLMIIISDFLNPLGHIIGLDGVILLAFILGFPANEIVMPIALMIYLSGNTLVDMNSLSQIRQILILNGWEIKTAICMMIFCLMHWPCSTTVLTIKKETGSIKWAVLSMLFPTIIGSILCFIVNMICNIF